MHTDKIFMECRPQCIYSSMAIRGPATGSGAAHARSNTGSRSKAGSDSERLGDRQARPGWGRLRGARGRALIPALLTIDRAFDH